MRFSAPRFVLLVILVFFFQHLAWLQGKIDMARLEELYADKSYQQVVDRIESGKVKCLSSEEGRMNYLHMGAHYNLYLASPDPKSPNRTRAAALAEKLLDGPDSSVHAKCFDVLRYLAYTVYTDIGEQDHETGPVDSIRYNSFNTQTLALLTWFVVPESWTAHRLYTVGNTFYSEAVYLVNASGSMNDKDNKVLLLERCHVLFEDAALFFEALCTRFSDCEKRDEVRTVLDNWEIFASE